MSVFNKQHQIYQIKGNFLFVFLNFTFFSYEVFVLVDGISSNKQIDRISAIKRLEDLGVILTTAESALFEIMRDSKHMKFT